jgi:formyltetrahydrofolate deformylase
VSQASRKDTAILLVDCPDRKGLVARIADFVFKRGANIVHSDQHDDVSANRFLMRVEWDLGSTGVSFETFKADFAPIAKELGMMWRMERSAVPTKLAIFVSRYDHCLADLLYRADQGELSSEVAVVVSNHPDAARLAEFHGVPFAHVPVTAATKAEAEAKQLDLLAKHSVSLVALARYMQVLSPDFLTKFGKPIINVHHSFLPAFSGAKPYQRAFARGVKLIGATSHYVTEDLDEGPIIEQGVARISHRDHVEDLIRRGRDLERAVLSTAVSLHAQHRIIVYGGKTVVFD